MSKLLSILLAILELVSVLVKSKKQEQRELDETKIKENPREFFEKGNSGTNDPSSDKLPDGSKD